MGYRRREWDTRAGTVELAIPKLRQGSYFPGFLEHRRRAERALASVVATSYLLGVSTRRVEKLAASLGVVGLSKSQVSAMAGELDELVESFSARPLDRGPYTFVWVDALTQKVREGGRTVNVHRLIATGVNADGCREILGIDVTSSEDGAGWLAFLRGLAARGLSGVQMVTSDDHAGLVSAIAAVLPGAAWQRCRTHYHRNLLTRVPKTAQPRVLTLVRTIFEQPDPASVRAQHAQVVAALEAKLPAAAAHLDEARDDILAFTAFPREVWWQVWSNNPQERLNKEVRRRTQRGLDLPWPRRHHPPGRRGAGRADQPTDLVPAAIWDWKSSPPAGKPPTPLWDRIMTGEAELTVGLFLLELEIGREVAISYTISEDVAPHALRRAPMVFKSIPDSGLTVVATCAFITSACFVTQDHPVYIPQLLSAVTGRAGGR